MEPAVVVVVAVTVVLVVLLALKPLPGLLDLAVVVLETGALVAGVGPWTRVSEPGGQVDQREDERKCH